MNWLESKTPKRRITTISARYVHHLTNVYLLFINLILLLESSVQVSDIRTVPNESIIIAKSVLVEMYKLPLKLEKMLAQKFMAESKSGILKNIQAKFTNVKVSKILPAFIRPLLLHFCISRAFSIIWNTPCKSPHIMNVQLAPCHIPLTRKVTTMFQYERNLLHLLPPSGIYM